MAKLAIKGHETRGEEIIKLLEMFGGWNYNHWDGKTSRILYFINGDMIEVKTIRHNTNIDEFNVFTLEEFLEKYPYKVGDKVILDEIPCTITWMCWECNNIYYQVQGIGEVFTKKVTADELNLYKERNGMGNKLAIKGHPTRGKEIIELLEMLGANRLGYKDTFVGFYYYIECGAICSSDEYPTYATIFTLEEFLEKYPYKVGDEVEFKSIGDANLKSKIIYMEWCNSLNKVLYTTEDAQVISTEDIVETKSIPPYMDYDIKENKEKKINQMSLANCDLDEVEIVLGDKFELKIREGKYYAIRKKILYPKTYEECCDVLGIETNRTIEHDNCLGYRNITLYDINLLTQLRYFRKLLICRDAYWKIAGEEMGLDKPWEPDWTIYKHKFCLGTDKDKVIEECVTTGNRILAFPTKEMRDAFYECFKELIEECKELL